MGLARILRRGAVAFSALVFGVSVAQAQDLKGSPETVFNWTSVYLGLQGGYGSADLDWKSNYPYASTGLPTSFDNGNGIWGGQIGYMVQRGNWVFGSEISFLSGFDDDTERDVNLYLGDFSGTMTARVGTLVLSTMRVGYAWGNTLGYVKGGMAMGLVTLSTDDNVPTDYLSRSRHWYSGWTFGAGVEYQIMPNLLLGVEYNYVTLDGKARTDVVSESGSYEGTFRSRVDLDSHSVMGRLSYKMDAPALATLLPF